MTKTEVISAPAKLPSEIKIVLQVYFDFKRASVYILFVRTPEVHLGSF